MTAIALDDEPIALELLADFAAKVPFLDLKRTFTDPFEAMAYLNTTPVDLLFLDIQMPDLTGLQFLQTLRTAPPAIIFTTAYRQYGVEGFNLDAVDYLLKPYDFERFIKAVNKARESAESQTAAVRTPPPAPANYIFVKSEHQLLRVILSEIRWLEAWGDYVKIFLQTDKPLLTLSKMSVFAEALPSDVFIRVHRSYIVHLQHITLIQKNRIYIGDKVIPIGESYTEHFYKMLPDIK